ncbi:MAG: ABC transporter permease [Muribaculaceae bacterium]
MTLVFLIEKEFKQMMRNIILPVVFVLLPLGMINIMPRAATQEVTNLKVTVVDNDRSAWSSRLVQKINASTYFKVYDTQNTYGNALHTIEAGNSDFIIEIEPDFEKNLVREGSSLVLISANAVNGVKAGLGTSYLSQIIADYSAQLREEAGLDAMQTTLAHLDVSPRYFYNLELDYKAYMIPGLIGMLLILIVGFLPALNIVLEKEKGTIEQINVTPVSKLEFIFSKLIPYWCIGIVILCYAMFLAWAIFGLVPAGNILLIFLFSTVFTLIVSSFGLIISNYSDTTQQAALVMFFFLVIFILLSGLLTPISSMPEWAQAITTVNPLRYYIEAMRCIYLKGSTLLHLMHDFTALCIYAAIVCFWAIKSYKKNV